MSPVGQPLEDESEENTSGGVQQQQTQHHAGSDAHVGRLVHQREVLVVDAEHQTSREESQGNLGIDVNKEVLDEAQERDQQPGVNFRVPSPESVA